jgi:transcriptional regulator with XRE-family HTH domain
MSTKNKRPLTPDERIKAQKLSTLWQKQKLELGLSQQKLSKMLGISQPTLSQYFNGIIPLNTDFIILISSVLRVSPAEIDPKLSKVKTLLSIRSQISPQRLRPSIIGTTSGKRTDMLTAPVALAGHQKLEGNFCAVAVDTADYEKSGITKACIVVLDMNHDPFQPNRTVAYRLIDCSNFVIAQFISRTSRSAKLIPQNIREEVIIPISEISAVHLVQAISHPLV